MTKTVKQIINYSYRPDYLRQFDIEDLENMEIWLLNELHDIRFQLKKKRETVRGKC